MMMTAKKITAKAAWKIPQVVTHKENWMMIITVQSMDGDSMVCHGINVKYWRKK